MTPHECIDLIIALVPPEARPSFPKREMIESLFNEQHSGDPMYGAAFYTLKHIEKILQKAQDGFRCTRKKE